VGFVGEDEVRGHLPVPIECGIQIPGAAAAVIVLKMTAETARRAKRLQQRTPASFMASLPPDPERRAIERIVYGLLGAQAHALPATLLQPAEARTAAA
jgi:hypothetical protein